MKLLVFDPSGSFDTGKGVTGFCVINKETEELLEVGNIKAKDFKTKDCYYEEHLKLIGKVKPSKIVIEAFVLYKGTASSFYHQELETSELIGEITGFARVSKISVTKQRAAEIKGALYKPNVLLKITNNQIEHRKSRADKNQWYFKDKRISNHIVDAIRHAYYYLNKKGERK